MNLKEVTRAIAEDLFRWRDTNKEQPSVPNEVIGTDKYMNRNLYVYVKNNWFFSTDYSSNPVEPPIKWHYLPERPFINPLEITNESNRTTT